MATVARHTLELILRRDRHVAIGSRLLVTGLAWAYVLGGAAIPALEHGMAMTDAHGHTMPMPMAWTLSYAILMALMWWIMMIAMMVPSAAPTVLLFAAIRRKQETAVHRALEAWVFLSGMKLNLSSTGLRNPDGSWK